MNSVFGAFAGAVNGAVKLKSYFRMTTQGPFSILENRLIDFRQLSPNVFESIGIVRSGSLVFEKYLIQIKFGKNPYRKVLIERDSDGLCVNHVYRGHTWQYRLKAASESCMIYMPCGVAEIVYALWASDRRDAVYNAYMPVSAAESSPDTVFMIVKDQADKTSSECMLVETTPFGKNFARGILTWTHPGSFDALAIDFPSRQLFFERFESNPSAHFRLELPGGRRVD